MKVLQIVQIEHFSDEIVLYNKIDMVLAWPLLKECSFV